MAKRTARQVDKKAASLSDREVVEIVLREMKEAVPEIERRVMEREAMTAEARFEAPRASDFTKRKGCRSRIERFEGFGEVPGHV